MIDKVSYRRLQRMTSQELEKVLGVNGGIVYATVGGVPTFVVQSYPLPKPLKTPRGS